MCSIMIERSSQGRISAKDMRDHLNQLCGLDGQHQELSHEYLAYKLSIIFVRYV